MAKIRGGALAAQISGSIAGQVFSHNRYGAYVRNRSIPVTSTTAYALAAKQKFSECSQAWQALEASEQDAWRTWADVNLIADPFGVPQALTGQAAFVQLGVRLLICGSALPTLPPVATSPLGLTLLTGEWDIGPGDFALTFTPTPLSANERLWSWASVVDSAGKRYVKNLLKLVDVSDAEQATGLDLQTAIEARFGDLSVGQVVHVECQVCSDLSGEISGRRKVVGTVIDTTV
ncbi:MAG TPA: hypothetical protein VMY35_14615 [Phycisphaerae bacterium]|nr:hypothetical protein [Phycisphaerae bacterium]